MLVPDSITPEPPALLPGEEEQLQQSTVMASAPGAMTPAAHLAAQSKLGNAKNMMIDLIVDRIKENLIL